MKLTSFEAAKKVALIKEIKGLLPEMNLVQVQLLHFLKVQGVETLDCPTLKQQLHTGK